eukprot:m.136461 g.136461  ORF g.136461 m.136461 type:complete len:55 (-) comp13996_c1_seq1:1222-1386(-)
MLLTNSSQSKRPISLWSLSGLSTYTVRVKGVRMYVNQKYFGDFLVVLTQVLSKH